MLVVTLGLAVWGSVAGAQAAAVRTGWSFWLVGPLSVLAGVLGAVMFRIAPHWILAPGRTSGLGWPLPDQLLASSYVWWGFATLVVLAMLRQPAPAPTEHALVRA